MTSDQPLSEVKILLIENDRDTVELFRFVLQAEGAHVVAVFSVREALSVLSVNQFNIVLFEPRLSDGEGYLFIEALRRGELGDNQHLPVVAVTASVRQVDREQARTVGCQEFLPKPVDLSNLIDVVLRLVAVPPVVD
ncbi:response regulator [Leptolyngbya sp. FACHB-541]|uniref:response regulator n=1 Tax=Leptolyngbya sp. FACHB-541 TaxID=2692810 RepID=UPI0016890A4E|nr:response regulator [Leptolyngbya sp. FACHB-541]MBD1999251.1 response regulator [Leptolyngbya sp. FACHB-541]